MYPPFQDSREYASRGYPAAGIPEPSHQQPCAPPMPPYPSPPLPAQAGRPWSTGLCHCFDDPFVGVITCFCPCITFGQISEIVNKGEPSCAKSGVIYGLLMMTGFACLYSCFNRSKMRAEYDLEEAPCADCLVHFCCEPFSLCQEHRELKSYGFDMGIGWQANVERQKRGLTIAPDVSPVMRR